MPAASEASTKSSTPAGDGRVVCVHEKHRIVRFFLGKRSLLVLTRPSGPSAVALCDLRNP